MASKFEYVTYIKTTPEKFWATFTDTEMQKKFWFGVHVETEGAVGDPWSLTYADGRVTDIGKILELDRMKRLVASWTNQVKPEFIAEGESRWEMVIEPKGYAVKVTLTHSMERDNSKLIAAVSAVWPMVISNLKSLLETGSIALKDPSQG